MFSLLSCRVSAADAAPGCAESLFAIVSQTSAERMIWPEAVTITDFDTEESYGFAIGIKDGCPAIKIFEREES